MLRLRRSFVSLIAAFCLTTPLLFADYNRLGIPDSSELRRSLGDMWLVAPLEIARQNRTEIRKNAIGQEFQIRLEEQGTSFVIIVAPKMSLDVDVYTEHGIEKQTVSTYPADAAGAWVLSRDSSTGDAILVRYYFAKDSDVYVQFSPQNQKTLADFVVAGSYAARSVPVGIPFDRFYTASFDEVMSLTAKTLPWKYADVRGDQYHSNLQMVGMIRKNLGRIVYADDAAYDEDGHPVYISNGRPRVVADNEKSENILSLSSAGFVKWIVDGLVEPKSGSNTLLAPLTKRTVEFKPQGYAGIRSETDDITFTLDWTRNLASAWLSVRTGRNYYADNSGVDVKLEPFSAEMTQNGVQQTAGYLKDTGYAIAKIRSLLYVLAVTEPTNCYLAAVRRLDAGTAPAAALPAEQGVAPAAKPSASNARFVHTRPEQYVFDQTAVLFPCFDKDGRFACTVFENGNELTLAAFVSKYRNCYVHLTRVLTSDAFYLQ